ncbi:MAG TPA: GNAT family N-acetyltransferase [Candidatus Lustribacter sp.]|nr:GNAT family N-acetyltransferase [Candidatus Lustribacter sp.]
MPSTNRWLVGGSEFLGHLSIRHRLTPVLVELGGHIGYAIRPSARRRGYGTRQLALALPVARGLGLGRLLVTCDEDNIGSARIIERSGGVLEDVRGDKRRYWIDVPGR